MFSSTTLSLSKFQPKALPPLYCRHECRFALLSDVLQLRIERGQRGHPGNLRSEQHRIPCPEAVVLEIELPLLMAEPAERAQAGPLLLGPEERGSALDADLVSEEVHGGERDTRKEGRLQRERALGAELIPCQIELKRTAAKGVGAWVV